MSENGVAASADKVKAAREYQSPKNDKNFRAFLGLASFYRRLVTNFAEAAKPLTIMTRKDQNLIWCTSQQEAFEDLKNRLSKNSRASLSKFRTSIYPQQMPEVAVAAILSEVQYGVENSIAYASRQLIKAEQSYAASEIKILALVWATKYFRCYLY